MREHHTGNVNCRESTLFKGYNPLPFFYTLTLMGCNRRLFIRMTIVDHH
jgi:hypothetical protein